MYYGNNQAYASVCKPQVKPNTCLPVAVGGKQGDGFCSSTCRLTNNRYALVMADSMTRHNVHLSLLCAVG